MLTDAKLLQNTISLYAYFCKIFAYICAYQSTTEQMKKILNEQLNISSTNPIKARLYNYKQFTYPWHFHGEFELLYVEKGYGQCLIGDSVISYSDQNLLFFGPELPHCMQNPSEYQSNPELRVNGSIIQFEKDFMQYSFSHYAQFISINNLLNESHRGIRFSVGDNRKVQRLLKKIPVTEGIEQIINFLQLLQELLSLKEREYGASPNYDPIPAVFKDKKIEKVIAYINKRYTSGISLDDISSYTAMNPSAFCRYFKENTGKTLIEYITDMRIGYACKLLSDDKMNISEICLECGFESSAHFNRSFKNKTGITPSEYRKKMMEA